MATFKAAQIIGRPVADVFNTVIHLEEFPKWNPLRNPSGRRLDAGEIAEGSRFELEIKGFGTVHQELQHFEKNRSVRVVPHIAQLRGGHLFLFTDLGGGRTRIDHELEMTPRGVFTLMAPVMWLVGKKNLRETMAALQKHLDGSNAVVPAP